ncbi:hypothetical protein [Hyphococcus sp.]|uniref:hypothetical protein n=1 Tax=Hyphococcus sp. TaxID=2038636 RepID=UPI003D13EAEF
MFSRDGLHYLTAFLIVGGLLTLAWCLQPETLTTEYYSEETCPYKTYHVGNGPDGGIEFRIERDAESCKGYDKPAENAETTDKPPETLAEADLLAQQQMAHWTRWIGGFTALGLFVLYVTFSETRKAVVETREIGQAQSRAYLSVIGGEFTLERNLPMYLSMTIIIRNTGNSPATDLRLSAEVCFEGYPEAEDFTYRYKAPALVVNEIGGQISYPREIDTPPFNIGILDDLVTEKYDVGIHGTIEYRHVFMKPDDPPDTITFALSGAIEERKAQWEVETVTMALNTCQHDRWEKKDA